MVSVGAEIIDPQPFNTCGPSEDPLSHNVFDRKWEGRASAPKHWEFFNGLQNICEFWSLIKTHDLLMCNIIKMMSYKCCSQMLCISLKTEKSFIAHPWCLLSVAGLEYEFSSWLASPDLGTARSSYLARVGPVVWYTTTTNHDTTHTAWTVKWRNNECDGVSHHWRLHCLLNRLLARRSKKTSKLRVTGLCEGYPPVTSGFPSQRSSNAKVVSIWLRHHAPVGMSCIHSIIADVWTLGTDIIFHCTAMFLGKKARIEKVVHFVVVASNFISNNQKQL